MRIWALDHCARGLEHHNLALDINKAYPEDVLARPLLGAAKRHECGSGQWEETPKGRGGLGGPASVQAWTSKYLHRNHRVPGPCLTLDRLNWNPWGGPENLRFNKNVPLLPPPTPVGRVETGLCRGRSGCQSNLGLSLTLPDPCFPPSASACSPVQWASQ